MAVNYQIPPWLNLDPLAPGKGFLQGFGQGAQVGTSRRVGEQQAEQFAQAQAARAQEMAFREAQAAIQNQLAQELADQRRAEFTANIRLKEKEAEREAAEAAEQALAMQQFRNDVRSGMNEAQAAARNPGIFGRSRAGLGSVISAMQRQSQASIPPTFVPAGGYAAPGDVPNTFQGWPDELVGLEGAPAHWRTGSGQVRFPPRETGESIESYDPEGRLISRIIRGGKGALGGLTSPVQTEIQKRMLDSEKVFGRASRLLETLGPLDVGVAGWTGQVVVNEALAQAFPELGRQQTTTARALVTHFNNQMIKTLKTDPQLNQKDVERLEKALTSLSPLEGIESAVAKIITGLREIHHSAVIDARAIGRPPPPFPLSPQQIKALHKSNKIELSLALELINEYYPNFVPPPPNGAIP